MKRLRDTEPEGPLAARARELIESVEPLAEDAARMQRVRRALDTAEAGAGAPRGRRWPALGIAAALGLFGASAFAAVRFVDEWRADTIVTAPSVEAAPDKPARRAKKTTDHGAQEPALEAQAPVDITDMDTDTNATSPKQRRPHTRDPQQPEPTTEAAAPNPHNALVHEALQALRHQQDPARAAKLLEQYAALAPHGPLAEEALSLRIEAAQLLGDARSRTLAVQYLQRYPGGRYAGVARRALGESVAVPNH